MKRGLFGALAFWACLLAMRAEVVMEFDGKEWEGKVGEADLAERVLKEGICFVADYSCRVGDALDGLGMDLLQPHAIRLALRGVEGKGAVFDSGEGFAGERKATVMVACEPTVVSVAHVGKHDGAVNTASMDVDFDGADGFLEVVRQAVLSSRNANEVPLSVLMIRSKCSYGLMVRVIQMMRAGGCRHMVIRVDDGFPNLDVRVIMADPLVSPPLGQPGQVAETGRITVNLFADGSMRGEKRDLLETDEAVKGYVERRKDEIAKTGKEPKLFLRGDRKTVFRECRRVIRISAEAGVDRVIFGVYDAPQGGENEEEGENSRESGKSKAIKWREQELDMALPPNGEQGKSESKREIVVLVESGGRIFMETGKVELDTDPKNRELPLFREALKKAKAEGVGLSLKIQIEKDTEQKRVIDVLNACANEGINSVTFADVD